MDFHDLLALLDAVRDGAVTADHAARQIVVHPFQDAGDFAKVDLHRQMRCGFPEVVFGQGKTAHQIEAILRALIEHGQGGLVTRLDPAAAVHLIEAFPGGEHNPVAQRFGCGARGTTSPSWGGW